MYHRLRGGFKRNTNGAVSMSCGFGGGDIAGGLEGIALGEVEDAVEADAGTVAGGAVELGLDCGGSLAGEVAQGRDFDVPVGAFLFGEGFSIGADDFVDFI